MLGEIQGDTGRHPGWNHREDEQMATTYSYETTCAGAVSGVMREIVAPATLAHQQRTAAVARELAAIHGVDPDHAELAALLHDIADHYSDAELLALARRYGIPVSATAARVPKLLHGAVGAEILRCEYGVRDVELLDAVRDHITGGPRMGPLAKVLFVADKIEPGRDWHYHGLDSVRELARVSLDEAIAKLAAWRIAELGQAGRPVDERLVTRHNLQFEQLRAVMG
jgi:predicted HD superfamily hydrolase involved in NAD metabolism